MARLPRSRLPEYGTFHVTSRGVDRCAISRDDDDRLLFLALLAGATVRTDWDCLAFCLMPNHHHLIVSTHQDLLSHGLGYLNGRYAAAFNERHGRSGHLFGARFAAFVITNEKHLSNAVVYVLQNPVRAGLCRRAADWRWSGSRRGLSCPPWLTTSPARSRSSPGAVAGSAPRSPASSPAQEPGWRSPPGAGIRSTRSGGRSAGWRSSST